YWLNCSQNQGGKTNKELEERPTINLLAGAPVRSRSKEVKLRVAQTGVHIGWSVHQDVASSTLHDHITQKQNLIYAR
ncbi:hypothetical protein BaRGS_00011587, partial [Batillaria attramentaria]